MSSTPDTAEQRYRAAFERLKSDRPQLLPRGTSVTQNNVAKEAGADPSALKLTRYPALIREIQAYVEIAEQKSTELRARRKKQRRAREDSEIKALKFKDERDYSQSQLLSLQRVVLELLQERERLRAKIEELLPPPTKLRQ